MIDNYNKVLYTLLNKKRRTRVVRIKVLKRVSGWCKLINNYSESSL